ncbi:MAG: hypothetical protein J7497_06570 [Chitinophagaceae bacterium]|nr:hypothetical protein [Chitinophagaceae bacterium]
MKKSFFSSWYFKILIAVAIAIYIYLSIDQFKEGYKEGRAEKARRAAEAAKKTN